MTSYPHDRLVPEHFTGTRIGLPMDLPTLLGAGPPVVSFLAFYRKYARSTFANAAAISATSRAAKFS